MTSYTQVLITERHISSLHPLVEIEGLSGLFGPVSNLVKVFRDDTAIGRGDGLPTYFGTVGKL